MRASLVIVLGFALSCAAPTDVKARHDEILGGAADATDGTVFLVDLRFDTGASICTAVLITPKVLLLAAHCVDTVFHGATSLMARATNKPDTVMLMMSDMIDVTVVSKHPNWNPSDLESDADLALVLLARAPAGVTPRALVRSAPAVGQMVRLVGYGRTSVNDAASSGTRRAVTLPITAVDTADFKYGSDGSAGICAGDSGGPSFLDGAVVGIHSRSEGSSCGLGVDMRIDRNLTFIDGFIAANDPPSCTGDGRCATGCGATTDPDCPTCVADSRCDAACGAADPDCRCLADQACDASCGLTDPDCADDGAVCTLAAECAGGQCLADPRGFKFCSRSCAASSECVNDMTCQGDVCRAPADTSKGDAVAGGCSSAPGLLLWLVVLSLRRR